MSDLLKKLGIDRSKVETEFAGAVAGRTLIRDGDGPAYVIAAKTNRLDTAIRQYQTFILTEMFMVQADACTVHFTAASCTKNGRGTMLSAKPYQGNRKGKTKPPLLEPLREAMALEKNWLPEFKVELHRKVEADDAMIIQAYQLKEDGVVSSEDKDLRLTPYLWYNAELGTVEGSQPVGYLEEKYTPAGHLKIGGRGIHFFWWQMLAGDTADNVKGILKLNGKLCGLAGAYEALKGFTTQKELANYVIDAYRAIDQNPLPEGWCLWLLRHPRDNFVVYLSECELSPENKAFIQQCGKRKWFLKPGEERHEYVKD